jgi:phosphohistidine phosphatase SixA
MLYLVRHAKAGRRRDFSGNDRLRPLSASGGRQAEALVPPLAAAGVATFISSPYLRCIETLEPTAKSVGAPVEVDERLSEGRSFVGVLELLESVPDATALCSHGDVIPETIDALLRRGCELTSPPDWRKASVWVLERNAAGEIVTAEAWPPPDVSK